MIEVRVRLFAIARDVAGHEVEVLSMPEGSSAADVLGELLSRFPKLSQWKNYLRIAVNQSYVDTDIVLQSGDEIAVIPPVSGG